MKSPDDFLPSREMLGFQLFDWLDAGALTDRDVLLVLDNCEHLVGACAELAEALLRGCPRLRLLGMVSLAIDSLILGSDGRPGGAS